MTEKAEKPDIVWKAEYRGFTGITRAVPNTIKAITSKGYTVLPVALSGFPDGSPLSNLLTRPPKPYNMEVLNQLPSVMKCRGYHSIFEFDKIPYEWMENLGDAEIIFTQSRFSRDIFVNSGIEPDKIHVTNFILDDNMMPEGDAYQLEGVNESFVFLSVFEWVVRKCPDLLIRAFVEEFDRNEDVALVLRTWSGNGHMIPKLVNKLSKRDGRVYWLREKVDDTSKLYRAADAYVSPTAGEGWGATLCEAMACGLPTIGSNHSGNLDFMNQDNSWLVDVEKWTEIGDAGQRIYWIRPWMKWRLPKIESIRSNMRSVYDIFKGMSKKERLEHYKVKNALKLKRQLSIPVVAEQYDKAIKWWIKNYSHGSPEISSI